MTQLELELEWITNPEWIPSKVVYHTNGDKEFDDFWSKSMGYNNINEMNKHNYKRDMNRYLTYGDKGNR